MFVIVNYLNFPLNLQKFHYCFFVCFCFTFEQSFIFFHLQKTLHKNILIFFSKFFELDSNRIRIEKAAGSGSALGKNAGSRSAKNGCRSTALLQTSVLISTSPYPQGWEFAHSLIRSFRSNQKSDCERFAQIAQDK